MDNTEKVVNRIHKFLNDNPLLDKNDDYRRGFWHGFSYAYRDALALLKEHDVVPVVRCKDCKYYKDYDGEKICDGLGEWYGRVPEDYFCADGKRR